MLQNQLKKIDIYKTELDKKRPFEGHLLEQIKKHPVNGNLVGNEIGNFAFAISAVPAALPAEDGQRVQPQFGVPPVPDSSAAHGHRGHNLARAVLGPLFPKLC